MTIQWIAPFSKRVDDIMKVIPDQDVLDKCIAGLNREESVEKDELKKWRLQQIKEEIQLLRRQLS